MNHQAMNDLWNDLDSLRMDAGDLFCWTEQGHTLTIRRHWENYYDWYLTLSDKRGNHFSLTVTSDKDGVVRRDPFFFNLGILCSVIATVQVLAGVEPVDDITGLIFPPLQTEEERNALLSVKYLQEEAAVRAYANTPKFRV